MRNVYLYMDDYRATIGPAFPGESKLLFQDDERRLRFISARTSQSGNFSLIFQPEN